VSDALQLQVRSLACAIIDHQDCALVPDENLLQREDLAPIAERALREQAQLR
jgi:hypothetical protein